MDSNEQIEQAAAEWIVRRGDEDWSTVDQSQLNAWLSTSMAHCAAFWRLEVAWEESARLQALAAGGRPGVVPPRGEWRASRLFDRGQVRETVPSKAASPSKRWALAAAILVACGIAGYLFSAGWGEHYATPVGGSASIPLKDGSNVTLNTASDIRVSLSERERVVSLKKGEAFFDVARDARRPFIVVAGGQQIVAVGTQFSVRRLGNEVRVVVTQGQVRVGRGLAEGSERLLTAGAIAQTSDAQWTVEERAPKEAEETLSWRGGYLTFSAVPLGEAIAEFNRYTTRRIVMRGSMGDFHVTGRFRANNVDAFLRVIHQGFGIEAHEADDVIVLTDGRGDAP